MNEALNISKKLIWFTIFYNLIEGIFAVYFGVQSNSTSLMGFGLDSFIEISASIIALWGINSNNLDFEKKAEKLIAYSFLVLAFFIVFKSILDLINQNRPEASIFGIIVATVSIAVEGPLSYKKYKIGTKLNNKVVIAEAKETLFCLNLSVLVIVGVGANYYFGLWYFDPIAALLMVPWLIYEFKQHTA